ncbi:MAG TPA: NAD(P)/FAD-dependent oxidoreductase [Pyrinomonadaceae bacterium]|nr:NAD(P)/FAD-dependent oxidoreductase [Pyrinomonadaceae bacterium]
MPHQDLDVLVIGAGAAGLAAARDLSVAGLKVEVLEAAGRLGGRVYTLHEALSPVPIELGAEFIHGRPRELFEILEASGLLFCDSTDRHWHLRRGELIKSGEFWQKLEQLMADMKKVGPADCSFQDYINSLPDDKESRETKSIACLFVEGFHATRADRISVQALLKLNAAADTIDGDKQFHILSGYDSVVEWLWQQAKRHGTRLQLNTIVKEIGWKTNRVEAICLTKDGVQQAAATRAVITLPLGVLQTPCEEAGAVLFDPLLPSDKKEAVNNLAMGHVLKIIFRFRERFWEKLTLPHDGTRKPLWELGFIHSADHQFPTWWTRLPVRAPIIVGWVGGPQAERGDNMLDSATDSLASILSVTKATVLQNLEQSYFHDWTSDVFTRGAYSYVPVNCVEAQASLSRPLANTLFFAGEATSQDHIGTVHGALASGHRAANEILELMN